VPAIGNTGEGNEATGKEEDMQPLVLLDVDGVINDLGALCGVGRSHEIEVIRSNGYAVHIPAYMPGLIREITANAEVWWCTTWRQRANGEIAAHLGIGTLPVVDDGTRVRDVGWKAAAASRLIAEALDQGRPVYWIEDFYGNPPREHVPSGVVFIDTAADTHDPVLRRSQLPGELLAA
jgi:hypothetical protein